MIKIKYKKAVNLTYFSYLKILGMLMRKGKKTTASSILFKALNKVSSLFKLPLSFILKKLYAGIKTSTELKYVKSRNKSLSIPFLITRKRKLYLSVKWLILGCKNNKQKISFYKKMFLEIFLILKKNPFSRVLQMKLLNIEQTLLHSSNYHYRW